MQMGGASTGLGKLFFKGEDIKMGRGGARQVGESGEWGKYAQGKFCICMKLSKNKNIYI